MRISDWSSDVCSSDLFELTPSERRPALAKAIADLLDGEVFAEMNDYVREDLIDALEPHEVADIASELDTDDAVAIIEDLDADDQREVLRAMEPDRSEEHTSELQSLMRISYAVFCLKKKKMLHRT